MILPCPAAKEITAYLDSRFAHPGAPYKALIIIRTLWLSDANNILDEMKEGKTWYIFSQIQASDPKKERTYMAYPLSAIGPGPTTVIGARGVTSTIGSPVSSAPVPITMSGASPQRHILTLDMDTGKLY